MAHCVNLCFCLFETTSRKGKSFGLCFVFSCISILSGAKILSAAKILSSGKILSVGKILSAAKMTETQEWKVVPACLLASMLASGPWHAWHHQSWHIEAPSFSVLNNPL